MVEGEEFDEVHTESSGEENEVSELPSQEPQLDTSPKDTPAVPQTNSAPSLLPPSVPDAATTAPNQVIIWCPVSCGNCVLA